MEKLQNLNNSYESVTSYKIFLSKDEYEYKINNNVGIFNYQITYNNKYTKNQLKKLLSKPKISCNWNTMLTYDDFKIFIDTINAKLYEKNDTYVNIIIYNANIQEIEIPIIYLISGTKNDSFNVTVNNYKNYKYYRLYGDFDEITLIGSGDIIDIIYDDYIIKSTISDDEKIKIFINNFNDTSIMDIDMIKTISKLFSEMDIIKTLNYLNNICDYLDMDKQPIRYSTIKKYLVQKLPELKSTNNNERLYTIYLKEYCIFNKNVNYFY